MRVIPSLFLSCLLLGLLARTSNGQLTTGQGTSAAQVGTLGSSPSGVPNLNDALSSILGPLLGGNSSNAGQDSLVKNLNKILNGLQNVSIGSLLQGILDGDLSTLQQLLGPILALLQSLPIVGPLVVLLSQVLRIPLILVTSIVALLLDLLIVLLNITGAASG